MLRGALPWSLAVITLAACVSPRVLPIGAGGLPFQPARDERELWARAEREEALLDRSRPHDDPALAEYLARIGTRLLPDAARAAGGPSPRYRVVLDPTLNAFAMPDGAVYLHSGLLSVLENEAQLAVVLARELAHVVRRDALKIQREEAHGLSTPATAGIAGGTAAAAGGTAVLSPMARVILGRGLGVAAVAALGGYDEDLERATDIEALEALGRAGYDTAEAPRLFARLRAEAAGRGAIERFALGTARHLAARGESMGALVRSRGAAPDGIRDTEEFGRRLRALVRDNARLDIAAGRFGLAERQLARVVAMAPRDAVAWLAYGDLYRLQAQRARAASERTALLAGALESYERSAALDPRLAEPYRQLGLLYYQEDEPEKAREAFARYLAQAPDAPDAPRIEEYLRQLER